MTECLLDGDGSDGDYFFKSICGLIRCFRCPAHLFPPGLAVLRPLVHYTSNL